MQQQKGTQSQFPVQSGDSTQRQSPVPSTVANSTDASREGTIHSGNEDSHDTHSVVNCTLLRLKIASEYANEFDELQYNKGTKRKKQGDAFAAQAVIVPVDITDLKYEGKLCIV